MATQTIDIVARDRTKGTLNNIQKSLGRIGVLAASAFGVGALTRYANSVQTISNRLKLVTTGQENLNRVFNDLTSVANRSRQDLDAVSDLYQKIALSTKDLGLTQGQATRTTETFSKLLSIAGADAGTASGAIRQFSQALGSGAFRGDEFNSVVEAAPQILDILAAETGKARGEIRALAADGKLTSDVLINSLLKASKDVDAQFAKTAPTLGQAFTVLQNNLLSLGRTASPVFNAISEGILLLANNLESAIVFALSFGAALAVGKVIAMTRAVGGLTLGVKALTVAIAKNPLGLIATIAASAGVAIYNLLKPILALRGELSVKLLYALETAANAFLGFFKGIGGAANEFGKVLIAAINPFDDISLADAFDGFGKRMKDAYQKGFEERAVSFISDKDRADFEKQQEELKNKVQAANDANPITIPVKIDEKELEKAKNEILSIEKALDNEREKILREFEERRKTIQDASIETFADGENTRKNLLLKIEEDKNKKLADLEKKLQEDREKARREELDSALTFANEAVRIEQDRLNQILEANKLNAEQLAIIGKTKTDIIAGINAQAARDQKENDKNVVNNTLEALKRGAVEEVDLKNMTEKQKLGVVGAAGKEALAHMATQNEKAFKLQKALAIAEALLSAKSIVLSFAKFGASAFGPIGAALGAAAGVAFVGAQIAAISSAQYTGPRERGGPVGSGQSYLVGEAGPELFVPNAGGTIVPNNQMDNGPVTVNFNINVVDSEQFDTLLYKRRGLITGIINDAMTKRGKEGVI